MTEISKEYASALFMLACEDEKAHVYNEALEVIDGIISHDPDYLCVLSSPAIPMSERLSMIDEAFSESYEEYIVSFLKLLCENGHIQMLSEIIGEFAELVRMWENRVKATVYYVDELTEQQKSELVKKLESVSKKSVDAVYVKDTSLIGGIKVELDDKILDGSIYGRLNQMKGVIGK